MHLSRFFFCNISSVTVFVVLPHWNSNSIIAEKANQKRTLIKAVKADMSNEKEILRGKKSVWLNFIWKVSGFIKTTKQDK